VPAVPGEVPDRVPPTPLGVVAELEAVPAGVVGWFPLEEVAEPEAVPVPVVERLPLIAPAVPGEVTECPAAPAGAEVAGRDVEELELAPGCEEAEAVVDGGLPTGCAWGTLRVLTRGLAAAPGGAATSSCFRCAATC
jgi:hypothetical protein